MKKYILPALTVIAAILFSACSNDDITINRKFTISVDASGIPAAFSNVDAGEAVNSISSVTDGFRLRVRVLVYNSEGKAVVNQQQYRDSYLDAGTLFSTELESGTYTFVAITDVVPPSSSSIKSIWTFTDENDINKALLTYNADSNTAKYAILGVQSQQVVITDETQNVILQPKPVGALVRVLFTGLSTAAKNNYYLFALRTNYTPKTVSFNEGNVSTTSEASEFNSQGQITRNGIDYVIDSTKETSDAMIGSYLFFLPCEINCRFAYVLPNKSSGWCGPVLTGILEAGVGYAAKLDLTASGNVVSVNSVATFTQPGANKASQPAPPHSLRLADVQ